MGITQNHKGEYYRPMKATEERKTVGGETIAVGETYLRFYHESAKGEPVAIHLISVDRDLSLTGFFKLPSDLYNEAGKMVALRCEFCGGFFLGVHDRFCCEAHGQEHFRRAIIDADENALAVGIEGDDVRGI